MGLTINMPRRVADECCDHDAVCLKCGEMVGKVHMELGFCVACCHISDTISDSVAAMWNLLWDMAQQGRLNGGRKFLLEIHPERGFAGLREII